MVSNRCKLAVKEELKKLGLHFILVDLGEIEIMEDISMEQRARLKAGLLISGLELMDDKRAVMIEKIKNVIIEMIHHSDEFPKTNYSDHISNKLGYDYTHLADTFSETIGTTIQQFIIIHKIERIKELIIYDELNISEIAWKMNYSSAAHLSNQFKKITGLTPSHFKQLKNKRRTPIEEIGNPKQKTEQDRNMVNKIISDKEELVIVSKELVFQKNERTKLAAELLIANKQLLFQDKEKGKRAEELGIANKELVFQNEEKEKRAAELIIANYARSLIEASLDPLFAISPTGKITDINEAPVEITGLTREKLIGSDFFNYFTEPKKARKGYQEVFAKGFVVDYPLTMRNSKKTEVLFNGSVYKDEKGDVLGVVVVARDITDQKRIARELTEAKVFAELATGIAEDAKETAENAVKSKQQFLSNMSHEIRTPMNAIIGFTKVLLKTGLTVKQKEYLSAIKVSGDSLIVLINDILDLAKVDAGKMTFEQIPFKMETSISAMLHLFEPKIQEKNLQLVKEYDSKIPEMLVGDSVRLHQIILNLVSNAVKFTASGKITVGVKLLHEDEDKATIEFSVADTGIGIPANKIKNIFEIFQQASSGTSRLYGGTGLGLAIVKQLVENQNGTISVKSKAGEGSVFSFILTFQKTKSAPEPEEEILELNLKARSVKVLVVEDIPINQLLMKTLLDDFGFELDIAGNGKIAIEKLKKKSYDVILMDLQMPEMNGFEATEYIRNKMNSKIPIIALTADVTTVDLKKCKAVGMNDYLAKPVDERILYKKIAGLLKTNNSINQPKASPGDEVKKTGYINMGYLNRITKSDPKLVMEMISLYLRDIPVMISSIKLNVKVKDWDLLEKTMHKMIPAFLIIGIESKFENIARKIQEHAEKREGLEVIPGLMKELENMWIQVLKELKEELKMAKNN